MFNLNRNTNFFFEKRVAYMHGGAERREAAPSNPNDPTDTRNQLNRLGLTNDQIKLIEKNALSELKKEFEHSISPAQKNSPTESRNQAAKDKNEGDTNYEVIDLENLNLTQLLELADEAAKKNLNRKLANGQTMKNAYDDLMFDLQMGEGSTNQKKTLQNWISNHFDEELNIK